MKLRFTPGAEADLKALARNAGLRKRLKPVQKALGQLELSVRHPSLQTHKYQSLKAPHGEDVFEAYAENNTPAAYRIFWHYGPKKGGITIVAISDHP